MISSNHDRKKDSEISTYEKKWEQAYVYVDQWPKRERVSESDFARKVLKNSTVGKRSHYEVDGREINKIRNLWTRDYRDRRKKDAANSSSISQAYFYVDQWPKKVKVSESDFARKVLIKNFKIKGSHYEVDGREINKAENLWASDSRARRKKDIANSSSTSVDGEKIGSSVLKKNVLKRKRDDDNLTDSSSTSVDAEKFVLSVLKDEKDDDPTTAKILKLLKKQIEAFSEFNAMFEKTPKAAPSPSTPISPSTASSFDNYGCESSRSDTERPFHPPGSRK